MNAALVSIVDDDASIRDAMTHLLRSMGCSVRCFPSAKAFLESDTRTHTSLIISDIAMQAMDGFEMCEKLRLLGQPPPTVFMTALALDTVINKMQRSGAVALLRKPVDVAHLSRIIDAHLSK